MIRIAEIEEGTIADEVHLEIGTRILRINGNKVRDGIDLTFLLAENSLEIELNKIFTKKDSNWESLLDEVCFFQY